MPGHPGAQYAPGGGPSVGVPLWRQRLPVPPTHTQAVPVLRQEQGNHNVSRRHNVTIGVSCRYHN